MNLESLRNTNVIRVTSNVDKLRQKNVAAKETATTPFSIIIPDKMKTTGDTAIIFLICL